MDLHCIKVSALKLVRLTIKLSVLLVLAVQYLRIIEFYFEYARNIKSNLNIFGSEMNSLCSFSKVDSILPINWNFLLYSDFLSKYEEPFIIAFGYCGLGLLGLTLLGWKRSPILLKKYYKIIIWYSLKNFVLI